METKVEDVVKNVLSGVRTKKELENCGCKVCKEALSILEMEGAEASMDRDTPYAPTHDGTNRP